MSKRSKGKAQKGRKSRTVSRKDSRTKGKSVHKQKPKFKGVTHNVRKGKRKVINKVSRKGVKNSRHKKPAKKRPETKRARAGIRKADGLTGYRRTKLKFLENNNVPYEAYSLDFRFRMIEGEPTVGINAETLRKLCESFRKRQKRGLPFGRLMINYTAGTGRGKKPRSGTVGTSRIALQGPDDWQELLRAFLSLALTLYEYDTAHFGEDENATITIRVQQVVLELINIVRDPTIDLPTERASSRAFTKERKKKNVGRGRLARKGSKNSSKSPRGSKKVGGKKRSVSKGKKTPKRRK